MTKDGLSREEKAALLGMGAVLLVDVCAFFDCPNEGCDECPLSRVVDAKAELIRVINEVTSK